MLTVDDYLSVGFVQDSKNAKIVTYTLSERKFEEEGGYQRRTLYLWLGNQPTFNLMVINQGECEVLDAVKIDFPSTVKQLKALIFGLGGVEIP